MTAEFRRGITYSALFGTASIAAAAAAKALLVRRQPDFGAVVRQFRTNFSNNEIEKNGEMVADDIVFNVNGGVNSKPNGATHEGRDQFVAWLKGFKTVFPDATITEDEMVVSGNKVAVRFTLVGTQRGVLPTSDGAIQPTGRSVTLHAAEFFTFNAAGQVTHLENLSNDLATVHQLTGPVQSGE